MKRSSIGLMAILSLGFVFTTAGCGDKKSATEQVAANVESAAYVLTPEDLARAEANAKNFYNKEWVVAGGQRGQFNLCKPTDSNKNGMVTCYGYEPKGDGTFKQSTMYCGYDGKIGGCSPEDLKVTN